MIESIILVEADNMKSEYGLELLNFLKQQTYFVQEDKINIPTNIRFRTDFPMLNVFNIFLKKLAAENTTRIIINL